MNHGVAHVIFPSFSQLQYGHENCKKRREGKPNIELPALRNVQDYPTKDNVYQWQLMLVRVLKEYLMKSSRSIYCTSIGSALLVHKCILTSFCVRTNYGDRP